MRPGGIISRRLLKRGVAWVRRRLGRGGPGRTVFSRGYARHLGGRPRYDALKAEGMTKRYAGLEVVSGVDLEVRAGEVLGIVGAKGAGKTTLIDLITGSPARTTAGSRSVRTARSAGRRDASRRRPRSGWA